MSALSQLLSNGNFIPVNKVLAKAIGLEESIILGELLTEFNYWEANDKLIDGEMFYCTAEKLEDNTTLTEYRQRKAIKNLIEAGILEQQVKGMPATRYFRINEYVLIDIIFQTSSEKIKELDPKKLQPSNNINIKTKNKISLSKDKDIGHFEFGKSKQPEQTLYSRCIAHIREFTDNSNMQKILQDFLASMSQMKKLKGEKQFISILNKLKSITEDPGKQIKVIQYSIEHGYATFYDCLHDQRSYNKGKPASTDIGRTSERAKKGEVVHEKF